MKAWRRRVKQGLLAKDGGGAICRHHPRLGRRGKDLILNRKGHILGGPNKKKSRNRIIKNNSTQQHQENSTEMKPTTQNGNGNGDGKKNNQNQTNHSTPPPPIAGILPSMTVLPMLLIVILLAIYSYSWKANIDIPPL
mmetsp:Transcript_21450/g.31754  ORF Transcript_21450/g.31754 Transcript_21450/m.31754 type:complete len:138 (+) Transcript_21450:142-555(+)